MHRLAGAKEWAGDLLSTGYRGALRPEHLRLAQDPNGPWIRVDKQSKVGSTIPVQLRHTGSNDELNLTILHDDVPPSNSRLRVEVLHT